MNGHQIRQSFLDFFAARGHRIVRSSSLVPAKDPTLLFTNAGMNQFKDVFLGLEKRDYSRAATSQKCVRAGGKHNDLENVGYTRRHHTFFEMLGNFSFGDYFKAEAIEYAWDLITREFAIPKDRLYITVFREDDEAEELWQKVAGVPKDRIFRQDEKDNFWQMGETGPCGPCAEIHYDLGPGTAEIPVENDEFPSESGRYVEIWNLVFMQYDRDTNGTLTPLPRPSIDTGMGLERIAAVLQGKLSNYDTDLLCPIIQQAASIFGVSYGEDFKVDTTLRIVADHSRATAFLIHDGVVPSNDGRGYVLRKIMRRAMRHARRIGVVDPFLYKLTGFVAELMRPAYPELMESLERVARIVKDEERRYATTFQVAEKIFHDEAKSAAHGVLPGPVAFKLYDTYGLPLEEQEEMAREYGLTVDRDGFAAEMEKQRERARASWKGGEKGAIPPVWQQLASELRTNFLGYEKLESVSRVAALVVNQQQVDSIQPGDTAEVVLDETPFYAEAGGQVGDKGALYDPETGEKAATVENTYAPVPGVTAHRVTALAPIRRGQQIRAAVDEALRRATMRNHTATHLLHAALRSVLGPHVKQAGSVVEPTRLRFDFTHYAAMDDAELMEVERLMNAQILRDSPVQTDQMELEKAIETGAMALFGEKYGDRVRVVSVPGFSRELCGGTHVSRTGEIGLCKIVYEGSISAGVRRIEAVTGEGALERFRESVSAVRQAAALLRTSEPELVDQVEKLIEQRRALERQLEQLKAKVAHAKAASLEEQARVVKGVRVLAGRVDGLDRQQMRELADSLRNKWKTAVIVLASAEDSSIAIVSAVTKDLTSKVHAGKLAGAVAQAVGGKGGGRPDMAEAGGKEPAALPAALESVYKTVEGML
ncbi:MAG TPA: alanine--tRNA ligase [Bryobacteraceae bacterium]|nr:alanine--tRNA ligase [Bryobacteraceae bacterium]HOQ46576.1 alanine--tRNA ligase [Bryobacteraceae bacterium]HPQ14163.1 alanine--tRNA ligase [Bryobacteraceae bacterium]HPU73367.1 alanine--tRNA ligase [Bryobacteraceae bacterium]